jgi:hypothetical protein|tara:strand:+ start:10961 stop:11173 length:213 start_codon:yes stop_codon:yes gene_type:complete
MKTTYQAYYQYELKKLLNEHIERIKETLVSSYQINGFDFSGYRHHVGRVEGLRMALELCDEAEAIVNGKE